jgi:hypothetical protein
MISLNPPEFYGVRVSQMILVKPELIAMPNGRTIFLVKRLYAIKKRKLYAETSAQQLQKSG